MVFIDEVVVSYTIYEYYSWLLLMDIVHAMVNKTRMWFFSIEAMVFFKKRFLKDSFKNHRREIG